MAPINVAHSLKVLAAISGIGLIALFLLGATPRQDGVPPQPYGANFFSGMITVQGQTPTAGTKLIGCVDNCGAIFESEPVLTDAGGNYVALRLNPDDEALVGRLISFYLVNEFGRISASETPRFEGDFNIYDLDLTFTDPIPVFKPAPVPTVKPFIPMDLSLIPETGFATAVTGVGFAADSLVTLTSEQMTLGTALTDEDGAFRLVIAAPSSVAGGYEITSTDAEGNSGIVTLTVPDLTGVSGVNGITGSTGLSGPAGAAGADGVQGAAGFEGDDGSIFLGATALSIAGLGILTIVVIYLVLIRWFKELARRLPPPGVR